MSTTEQDDIFDAANIPESNWFKFDKVGDKVSGTLAENPRIKKDTTGQYGDQKVFVLTQKDGSTMNVGIRLDKDNLIQRTNKLRQGDKVGFEFVKEIPASKKGYNPAKSIEVYVKLTEEGDKWRAFEAGGANPADNF
jgi:hypothetical protein